MLLELLSEIEDLKDFRLKDVMQNLNLDPRQPSQFYRLLLLESRQAMWKLKDQSRLIKKMQLQNKSAKDKLAAYELDIKELAELRQALNALTEQVNYYRAISTEKSSESEAYQELWIRQESTTKQLQDEKKRAEDALNLYRNIFIHLFGGKPFFIRRNSEGWYEVVFPQCELLNKMRQLVFILEPNNPRVRVEPYEMAFLLGLSPYPRITLDDVLSEMAKKIVSLIARIESGGE